MNDKTVSEPQGAISQGAISQEDMPREPLSQGALQGPLQGIRVIALEQAISMPFCTFKLAEMGAEVIKIERPVVGDVVRGWDSVVHGLSSGYVWVNAGKKSICVNLKSDQGRALILELVSDADVFVENMAPGAVDKLGFDYAALKKLNPSLIYCSLSGYGHSGPYEKVKAYDLTVQCETGILLSNGYPGKPAKVGLPITDLIAGTDAVQGILSALFARERTGGKNGEGRYLDVSMFASSLLWLGYFPHRAWHEGTEPPMSGMHHQFIAPYGPYPCSDNSMICLVVADDSSWRRFCEIVAERPEWINDERIASIARRKENRELVEKLVTALIEKHPREYWVDKMETAGLPYGRVRTMAEVVEHPQAKALGLYVEAESPVGKVPVIRDSLSHKKTREIPGLGQHTEEVLLCAGYTEDDLKTLKKQAVIEWP